MGKSIFDGIDREQVCIYLLRFSLLGILSVVLGVIAFFIKSNVFPASDDKGYILFIIRNLFLSILLLSSDYYIKKEKLNLLFLSTR